MRIAIAAAPNGRAAIQERQRRARAVAPPLRVLYPTLATLQLDFDFSGRSAFLPSPQVTVFHPPARAYFCFACPYSDCDGEFDLNDAISQMMDAREACVDGHLDCAGMRLGAHRCTLSVKYSLAARWC